MGTPFLGHGLERDGLAGVTLQGAAEPRFFPAGALAGERAAIPDPLSHESGYVHPVVLMFFPFPQALS